ncbi:MULTISPECIES: hypothetical protein [Actinoalloteichus]|uniref:WD40 repeat-containing protein n=1 Tax=Actinoalloteichus fjordicus TaxID=1612552 RepID=A0AAC9LF35_9PSEU|nr:MULTISPECIES: hypothetical protein [Actinoalloteichus]APU15699.1 WD40 repeat-containing protein [Actinoalloteichus fjordicus]APU21759.1 WD40 repeat-containing protein [Actinoalloteichus sp. GBA129-24]
MSGREDRSPEPDRVQMEAQASGEAEIYQSLGDQYIAERDLHLTLQDGVRSARRATSQAGQGPCPYPGLAAFDRDHASWFFGRNRLVAEVIERLDERRSSGGALMVIAPSGAGKSSLLRAGLIPALEGGALDGSQRWPGVLFSPTAQPMLSLTASLARGLDIDRFELDAAVAQGPARLAAVVRAGLRRRDDAHGGRLILIVDQLEELFTLCEDESQGRAFVDALTTLAAPDADGGDPVALVVCGLRADFYGSCAEHPCLRTALRDGPVIVGPMTTAELRETILFPAASVGLTMEPGLVELLLGDLGGAGPSEAGGDGRSSAAPGYASGRLPLLAHALRATWQQRHGSVLTVAGYRATGGIAHAVATTAERVFTGLPSPAAQQAARTLFLRLVKIGEGVEDVRRRVATADLHGVAAGGAGESGHSSPSELDAVLAAFTASRLLTWDRDSVEITHEALLHAWPRLRDWINADRHGSLVRQEIEEAASTWDRGQREAGSVFRGGRLDTARRWADRRHAELSPVATDFLAASIRRELRDGRLRTTVVAALSVLTLVAASAAIVAVDQRGVADGERARAEAERDNAVVSQLNATAHHLRDADPSIAAGLDAAAFDLRPSPNTYTHLLNAANTALYTPLAGHEDSVYSTAFTPDGTTLISADRVGGLRLWDLTDPEAPRQQAVVSDAHVGAVWSIAVAPDGRTLASAGDDQAVRLWNVADPTEPVPIGEPLTEHGRWIGSLVFSSDGSRVFGGDDAGTVHQWTVADPTAPAYLGGQGTEQGLLSSLALHPEGHTLATASYDGTIRLWDAAEPGELTALGEPLTGHLGEVFSVAFSPDGRMLASAGADAGLRLWSVADPAAAALIGEPVATSTTGLRAVAFSPNGALVATGSMEGPVQLWNVIDPNAVVPRGHALTGHTHTAGTLAFSPNGRLLASGSGDRRTHLWNLPETMLLGHAAHVEAVSFRPDGRVLASMGFDDTLRFWDTAEPAHPAPLSTIHDVSLASIAFSPDGTILAGAGADTGSRSGRDPNADQLRLWGVTDAAAPTLIGSIPLDAGRIAFAPDGTLLASGGDEQVLTRWDVGDPAEPVLLDQSDADDEATPASALHIAVSQDGDTLATSHSDGVIRLWSTGDGLGLLGATNTEGLPEIWSTAFSPDGSLLASAGEDGTVRLWDHSDPTSPVAVGPPLTGHDAPVTTVAFTPDGKTLVSGSDGNTIRLWDVSDPRQAAALGAPLIGHGAGSAGRPVHTIYSVAVSSDGRTLASAGGDTTVGIWPLDIETTLVRTCPVAAAALDLARRDGGLAEDAPVGPDCG